MDNVTATFIDDSLDEYRCRKIKEPREYGQRYGN